MSNGAGKQFLQQLKIRLNHLPPLEVGKVLSYYSESLEDKLEDGFTEEEAVKSFGSIEDIVKNIEEEISLSTIVIEKVKSKRKKDSEMNKGEVNKILIIIMIALTFPIWIGVVGGLFGLILAFYSILWTIPIAVGSMYVCLYPIAITNVLFGFVRIVTMDIFSGLALLGVGIVSIGIAIAFYKPIKEFFILWIKLNIWPFKKIKQWLIRR